MRVASLLVAVLAALSLAFVVMSWQNGSAVVSAADPLQARLQRYRGTAPLEPAEFSPAASPAALPAILRPQGAAPISTNPAQSSQFEAVQLAGSDGPTVQERLQSVRRNASGDAQPPEILAPQATSPSDLAPASSDDPQAPRRFSVLRREGEPTPAAGVPTPRALPKPLAVGEPTPAASVDPRGSSRRVASLPRPAETVTPKPVPSSASPSPAQSMQPAGIVAPSSTALAATSVFAQQSASLGVEMVGPKSVLAGRPTQYTFHLRNTAEVAADEVVVFVAVPLGIEITGLQSTSGAARIEGQEEGVQRIRWSIERAAPRSQEQMSLTLLPKTGEAIALEAGWTCRPSFIQTQIDVLEPKLEVAVNGPSEVQYGETATYTLVLHNPGTGDAENVTVQLAPLSPTQPAAPPSRIGTLKAGERKQLEIELTAREAGLLQIQVTAASDGNLRAEAGHRVTVRRAKLEIAAQAPPLLYTGTTSVYSLSVVNSGDAVADNVTLSATLPNGAKFESASDGGSIDGAGRTHWTLGTLRPGQQRTVELRCLLTMAGQNRLELAANGGGQLAASGTVVTEVESVADLKLTVNDPTGPLPLGKNGEFEIRIVNRGAKAAEQIQVVASFADGVEALSVTGGRADITGATVTFAPIARILPGQEVVLAITARGKKPGNHVFRAEVLCRDPETSLVAQETTRFYGDTASGPSLAYPPAAIGSPR